MKLALRLGLGLLVLLLLAFVGAGLFLDSLAKQAVVRGGTHALGVETRLESADLGLLSGEFALAGLAIANPPGFAQPDFFTLRSTQLQLPLSTLLESRITIPSLELEGIAVDLERNSKGTNYGVILDHLARFEGGSDAGRPSEPPAPDAEGGKAFTLQRLVLRDIRASVNLLPQGGDLTKLSLAIPEIVVEDLDSEMTLAQICALVVKTVIRAAIQAGGDSLPAELLADLRGRMDALEGQARTALDAELGKLQEKLQDPAKKLGPEAEKALQEAGDKLGGKLDGLLKKKKD